MKYLSIVSAIFLLQYSVSAVWSAQFAPLAKALIRDPEARAALAGKVDLKNLRKYGFDYVLSRKHASTILPVLLKHTPPSIAYKAMGDSIRQNNVRSFQLLLDAGVSPLYDNNLPVRLAASNGCSDILEILLKTQGVDPAANENEAIRRASQNGQI